MTILGRLQFDSSSDSSTDNDSVRGVVSRITYRNPENGYTVLQLDVEDQDQALTVVGHCLPFEVGTPISVKGDHIEHSKFGLQLQARTAEEIQPSSKEGIIRYLGGGILTGVGPKTAERIVEKFGEKSLEVIFKDPEALTAVPGISRKKALGIADELERRKDRVESEKFFAENNISPGLAQRIIDAYGENAVQRVKRDPYSLAYEMRGVGFSTADSIALNIGFAPTSPERLRGGLFYALQKAMDDGHCYLPRKDLLEKTRYWLQIDEAVDFDPHIETLSSRGFLKTFEERVYIKSLYEAERFVARFIANRTLPYNQALVDSKTAAHSVLETEKELAIKFSFEQQQAVEKAVTHPLLVITGGPGCGKTTVIRALTATFARANKIIALAAPTGKAAQRMSQVTEMEGKTIHRLLKYDPISNTFKYNGNSPIKLNDDQEPVDVVIIDEASMLDIQLARDLFVAIPVNATLILVGDKDQLPSVGPGRVFAELVGTPEIPVINLATLFRRSEESNITTIAHTINSGIVPDIPTPDGQTKSDVYFIPREEQDDCARVIESLLADQIPNKFDIPLSDITVLTPSNRGPMGTIQLNQRLQERLNPLSKQTSVVSNKTGDFRIGDRVCQRVNNYKIDLFGVFNGDIGQVAQIDEASENLVVELWDGRLIRYSRTDLNQLSLSYAMTVHRSQGSEMPCVVLALHTAHFTLLERQLLYTAVTRAKKLLIIVGNKRALKLATQKISSKNRLTSLKESIQEFCF